MGVCSVHRKLLGLSSGGRVSRMDSEEDVETSLHPPRVQNADLAEGT